MLHQVISTNTDPIEAVREVRTALLQSPPGIAVVFCSPRYDRHRLETALLDGFAGIPLVGCTSAGEISRLGYTEGGISGLSIAGDACVSVSRRLDDISNFRPAEGRAAAEALLHALRQQGIDPSPHDTFGLLVIDGLRLVEEQVISAISTVLGGIPIFGGSAADDHRKRSDAFVLHQGRFHTDAAVLVLVHTRIPFRVFSSQHFVGTGEQVIVTGAVPDRRIVTELNGECAALEYARLLGRDVEELRSLETMLPPLVVRVGGAWYARSIERLSPDNTLQLACAIDEGIPLSVGRNTGMLPNLRQTFEGLHRTIGKPAAVLGFDCIMRRLEIDSTGIEAEMRDLFAENRVIGCSAYGEQINGMHLNHTFTAIAFGEFGDKARAETPPPQPVTTASRLEDENAKLRKTVRVLLQRLERSMNMPSDTFSLFQNNVLLETTVQRRTEELAELNRQLNSELVARREMEEALILAKAQAEQANRSKTDFLAAISHDLQQPMNAARLLLGALIEEKLSPAGRSLLGRIEGALEAAEEMLADLLDVAKLEAGGITPQPSHFAMAPLLAQLEAEYAPQAKRRSLSLRVVQNSQVVHTDSHLLQRVLRNLLANAIRYTREGRILVGCLRRGDRLLVGVWDTGIGIPEHKLDHIFLPFQRLAPPLGQADMGSGLGLTIAQNISAMLGLRLHVRSVEGGGSCFTVEVPLGDKVNLQSQTRQPPKAPALLEGRRILIIDDDAMSRESLAAILRAWECETLLAATTVEAASLLAFAPDMLIVDYHLGATETGLDAIETLSGLAHAVFPALVVSADASSPVTKQVRRLGYEFLAKPINPARLRSALTYLLCCTNDIGKPQ
ncbi:Histidine kinase [Candidatus Terasakiella magnetica]|nr:Histidine kinase [Candidatus Terasakiella magnetica]